MNLPRLALVGSTHEVSPWLLHALRRHASFEAICDENPRRDAALQNARWTFTDIQSLLEESEPAGVVITLPPNYRHDVIKKCLPSGASVLTMGLPCKASRLGRLSLMAKLAGRSILASSPLRFAPVALLARRLIDSGKFGEPMSLSIQSTRRGAAREGLDDCGPIPSDQVFEAVDISQYLFGPITEVSCTTHDEGAAMIVGRTDRNLPFSMVLHASGPPEALGIDLEMRSLDGTIMRIGRGGSLSCGNGSRVDAMYRPGLANSDPIVELGYDGLIAEFARLVVAEPGGAREQDTLAAVVEACEAILTGCNTGRKISVKLAESARNSEPSLPFPVAFDG